VGALRCAFCGAHLAASACVWVQLPDGGDFVCCPAVCPPMLEGIEARRRELLAGSAQLALPLATA
jgi:hypothetical protein